MATRITDTSPLAGAPRALKRTNIDQAIDIDDHSLAVVRRILRRTGDIALARSYIPTSHARANR